MEEQITNIFQKYEGIIHEREYAQLVIDIIQNGAMDWDHVKEKGLSVKDFIGHMHYTLDTQEEVMKDGKDKDLLSEMKNEFEQLK